MTDLLLTMYCNSIVISIVQLQIIAYITRENYRRPLENVHKLIQTILFKPNHRIHVFCSSWQEQLAVFSPPGILMLYHMVEQLVIL